jgi:hypothetical protein
MRTAVVTSEEVAGHHDLGMVVGHRSAALFRGPAHSVPSTSSSSGRSNRGRFYTTITGHPSAELMLQQFREALQAACRISGCEEIHTRTACIMNMGS